MEAGPDRARAMELFVAAIDLGSFSAAARAFDQTPSSISRAIDRLESRLGVRLLLRSTRALTLTAEGQAYLLSARRILADLDDAEQQIADHGVPRGRLRVSAALSHGRMCIVPLLGEFTLAYPHVLVDLALTDAVVDVAAGQADVAIRFGPLADSTLTARKLGETRRVIVASPGYLGRRGTPVTPEDLHDHDCLNFSFRRAEPVWPFRRDGEDFTLSVTGPIEANNGDSLAQLAIQGVGITRVGEFSVHEPLREGRLVPLLEGYNPGDIEQIHAVFVGGSNLPARVRVFVDFLAQRLHQSGDRGMQPA